MAWPGAGVFWNRGGGQVQVCFDVLLRATTFGGCPARARGSLWQRSYRLLLLAPGNGWKHLDLGPPQKSFWYEMDMNDTKCTSNDVRFWSHFLLKTLIKHAPNYIFGARNGSPFMIRNLHFEGILDSKKALGVGPGPGGFTVSYRLLLWRLSPVRCSEVRTAPERRSYRLLL